MTSFAFILGVVPLVIATGAGAEMRRSLGTAVFSGMFGVTLFGIFLTPVFFYVIQGLSETRLFTAVADAAGSARRSLGGLAGAGDRLPAGAARASLGRPGRWRSAARRGSWRVLRPGGPSADHAEAADAESIKPSSDDTGAPSGADDP